MRINGWYRRIGAAKYRGCRRKRNGSVMYQHMYLGLTAAYQQPSRAAYRRLQRGGNVANEAGISKQ